MKKQLISSLKQSLTRDPPSPLSYNQKPTPSNYSSYTNTQIDYSKNHEVSLSKVTPQYYNLDSDEEQQHQRQLVNENQQLDEDMMEEIEQEMMRDQQERKVSNGNIMRNHSTMGNKRIVQEKHQMANRSNSRGNFKKTYFQDSLEDQADDNRDTEYIQEEEEEQTKIDNGHKNLYKSNKTRTNYLPSQKKVTVATNNHNANTNTVTITNQHNTNKVNLTANSNTNKTTTHNNTNKPPTPSNKQMLPPVKRPFYPKSRQTVQESASSSAQSALSQSTLAPVIGKRERSSVAGEEYCSSSGQQQSSSSYRQQSNLSSRQQRQKPSLTPTPPSLTPTPPSLIPTKKLNQSLTPNSNLKPVKFSIHIKLLQSNLPVTQMLRCITQNNIKEQALYLVQLQSKQKKTITNQQMTYFYKDALINYYQDLHFSVDTQSESGGNQVNK